MPGKIQQKYSGTHTDKTRLAEKFFAEVRRVAKRSYETHGGSYEDTYDAAVNGFMNALQNYDPAQSEFRTHARRCMAYAIMEQRRADATLSRGDYTFQEAVRSVYEDLVYSGRLGEIPDVPDHIEAALLEMAARGETTGLTPTREKVILALDRIKHGRRIIKPVNTHTPEDDAIIENRRQVVRDLIDKAPLSPKQRRAVKLYYTLAEPRMKDVAKVMGIRTNAVHQYIQNATVKLKQHVDTLPQPHGIQPF
jgi:RNA polymerase sigma factor (sigma-70 family)